MLANVNPSKLPLITLRYCLYFLPIGALCAYYNMTTWTFAWDSLIPEGYPIFIIYFGRMMVEAFFFENG